MTPFLIQRFKNPKGPLFQLTPQHIEKWATKTFTDAEAQVINQTFVADYMGAAEYEFGAIREALCALLQNPTKTHQFTVTGKPVSWGPVANQMVENSTTVFVTHPHDITGADVETVIRNLAANENHYRLKERACIAEGLFGRADEVRDKRRRSYSPPRWDLRLEIAAWLDLEHRWFATRIEDLHRTVQNAKKA